MSRNLESGADRNVESGAGRNLESAQPAYTELEWNLTFQAPAVNSDVYQFRVYAGTVPLPDYPVTAELTVGGADATATPAVVTATVSVPAPTPATFDVLHPVSISGRKLLDQHGAVYLMRTFSSWAMAQQLSDADITQALTDVAANGFNAVTVWIGGGYDGGAGWNEYTNEASDPFWTGTPWQSSLETGWTSVDWIVVETARLGLAVNLSFCGGNPTGGGAGDEWEAADATEMRDAGIAIATRYQTYPHIVWHVMFDNTTTVASTRGQRINSLFDGINDTEGASTRPVRWTEVGNGNTTDEQDWYDPTGATTDTRFSIDCIYEYTGDSAVQIEAAWAEVSGPVGDCEPIYIGNTSFGLTNPVQQYRERNYAVFLEGGCLINFGHEDWWPFGGAGIHTDGETWDTVVTDTEVVQASYAWTLIDTYCADTTYAPTSSFVTTGEGTTDTKAAQGASNTAAIAYFPDNRTVAVDTTILPGTTNVRLRWYDPTAGTYTTIAASEAQSAGRSVTLPAAHGDGTRDWILVVDLLGDVTVTATVVTATVSVLAPSVSAGANVSITAVVVTTTTAAIAPTTSAGSSTTATVVTATTAVQVATASANTAPAATVVTTAVAVPAPTVTTGSSLTATVATTTVSVPAPAVSASGAASVTALVVTATASVGAPTATASAAPTATVVGATTTVPAPTASASAAPTAAVTTATTTVAAATARVGSTATATVVAATVSVATPGISAGSTVTVTATVVTATTTVLAPTAGAGAAATANVVTATATPLAITPSQIGQTATAATITATATILAATLLTGTIFTLAPHIVGRHHTGIIPSTTPTIGHGRSDNRIIRGHD